MESKKEKITVSTLNQGTTIELTTELEKGYAIMNKAYFKNALPDVTITLTPDVNGCALGWMYTREVWSKNGKRYYEINICSDHLNRSKVEIYATLLHEMVHLDNVLKGIKDTSRKGVYHNAKFKESAESHGLKVEKSDKYGYAHTSATEKTAEWMEKNLPELVDMCRDTYKSAKRIKAKTISYKYVCPVCGNSVRAYKELNLICGDCKEVMEAQ